MITDNLIYVQPLAKPKIQNILYVSRYVILLGYGIKYEGLGDLYIFERDGVLAKFLLQFLIKIYSQKFLLRC